MCDPTLSIMTLISSSSLFLSLPLSSSLSLSLSLSLNILSFFLHPHRWSGPLRETIDSTLRFSVEQKKKFDHEEFTRYVCTDEFSFANIYEDYRPFDFGDFLRLFIFISFLFTEHVCLFLFCIYFSIYLFFYFFIIFFFRLVSALRVLV